MIFRKIACCTDFSENAEVAFDAALELAEKFDASLDIIHVLPQPVSPVISDIDVPVYSATWESDDEIHKNIVLKIEEKMRDHFGSKLKRSIKSRFAVLDGHISTEIINYLAEHNIDLVVMGSYGFSGMGLVIFGSVAKRVAHRAGCSVMIARK